MPFGGCARAPAWYVSRRGERLPALPPPSSFVPCTATAAQRSTALFLPMIVSEEESTAAEEAEVNRSRRGQHHRAFTGLPQRKKRVRPPVRKDYHDRMLHHCAPLAGGARGTMMMSSPCTVSQRCEADDSHTGRVFRQRYCQLLFTDITCSCYFRSIGWAPFIRQNLAFNTAVAGGGFNSSKEGIKDPKAPRTFQKL